MLSRAMQKADRISKLTSMGKEGFKDLMNSASRSKTDIASYSKPRQRWIIAIKKVQLRLVVDQVRIRVDKFEESERLLADAARASQDLMSARNNLSLPDSVVSAIQVADERTQTGLNVVSPRLQPIEKQNSNASGAGAAATAATGKSIKSNAVELPKVQATSTRARRQTADGGAASTKISARGGAGAAAAPLQPVQPLQPINLSNIGGGVAAAAAAAAGALTSLTHAVEGALGKTKQTQSTEEISKSARSGKSRRRSTLESKVTPTASTEGNSVRAAAGKSKKTSIRFKETDEEGAAAGAGAGAEGATEELNDADCVEPSLDAMAGSVQRLRRVTEAANEDASNLSNGNADNSAAAGEDNSENNIGGPPVASARVKATASADASAPGAAPSLESTATLSVEGSA